MVLPTEAFQDYVEHPLVQAVSDRCGFFPCATHHYRERRDGIEEYIFIYCTAGSGFVYVNNRKYMIHENEGLLHTQVLRP